MENLLHLGLAQRSMERDLLESDFINSAMCSGQQTEQFQIHFCPFSALLCFE